MTATPGITPGKATSPPEPGTTRKRHRQAAHAATLDSTLRAATAKVILQRSQQRIGKARALIQATRARLERTPGRLTL
jgi:hypothetical protein